MKKDDSILGNNLIRCFMIHVQIKRINLDSPQSLGFLADQRKEETFNSFSGRLSDLTYCSSLFMESGSL